MRKKFSRVYQFKITLNNTKPPIWRRIQVPETYTFWDFHVAIQDAMGWSDYHLHEFEMLNPSSGERARIGIPDEDLEYDRKTMPGWRRKIADWFSMQNTSALYKYDFGDNWRHTVTLEKILPRQRDVTYPRCVGGRRACPPEDCGGTWGYQDICDGKSAFQENYWDYNPSYFNAAEVRFDDPDKRWTIAFAEEE